MTQQEDDLSQKSRITSPGAVIITIFTHLM